MQFATVFAHAAFAEQNVVSGQVFHFLGDLGAVIGFAGINGFEVMQHTRVHTGLVHGRVFAAIQCSKTLGPCAGLVVQVPVKGFGQVQALCFLQSQRMDVSQKHQQAGHGLTAFDDAEFVSLFDGIGGIAACIGQTDDLGFGGLRLQQKRREVLGGQRVAHFAKHLAAVF